MNKPQKIRWLIAHEPVELFLRTAEAFAKKLAELTDNKFEVEIYTPHQYIEQVKQMKMTAHAFQLENGPMIAMDNGEIEMSQLHSTELANWHDPDFFVVDLPFLFRDHDHATRVFEGELGQGMLSRLADNSPATGLAFTYSGGFRCVASDNNVSSIEDFRGKKFATAVSPILIDTFAAVGAIPDAIPQAEHGAKYRNNEYVVDSLETTIPRYKALFQGLETKKKFILNTKHNLFITSIIISTKFWNSLDQETQLAFREATLYSSRLERQWSVNEAEEFAAQKDHSDIGVTFAELDEVETEKFKELTKPLYEKYKDFFYPGLVDGIIKS